MARIGGDVLSMCLNRLFLAPHGLQLLGQTGERAGVV